MKTNIELIDPEELFRLLNCELPEDVRSHVLVAGSLAAAFHHRASLTERGVKTKDADLLIHPAGNVLTAAAIGEKLLAAGWKKRLPPGKQPGTAMTPADQLPAIRLYPPNHERYFIELLLIPNAQVRGMEWQPVRVGDAYFGLAMFEFMALLQIGHCSTEHSIAYAKPSMMALANLLSHPTLSKGVTMSSPIEGRTIHRSAKDLGRVLAIARLTSPAELDEWSNEWAEALRIVFPQRWHDLAKQAGQGLRALLQDAEIFEEAHHTCSFGLLAGKNVSPAALEATARQFLQLVVEPLEELAAAPAAG